MKLLLYVICAVYLIQAYRLASLVHREAGVDVSILTMFLRSLNPTEPEPGLLGMLQNIWWLWSGKQLNIIKDIILSKGDGAEFPTFIEMLHVIEQDVVQGIMIPIAIRDASTFAEVQSNLGTITMDIAGKNPKSLEGREALNRIRGVAKEEGLTVDDILDEIPKLLVYVKRPTVEKLSDGAIRN